ncbi:MAG: glycosyltransferase [Anaerolineae bacterium]|nr:MAG: glycosyltransferase [Anaerolineae bacterium]WKZ44799.1 MAG: glycosyltransferase family 2 protein [Anaerolineales bacterium]
MLISIITPSFNQARYLEQTIQSVLGQDYPHIEYIVVDGASTDGSVVVIKKYADKLAWWVSEKDSGQAEAINKGLARAKGEIVAWLNSDDYYLPSAVSAAMKVFEENPDMALVYGNMLAVDERGNAFNSLTYKQLSLQELLCFQIIGQPAVFFRREALEKAGMLDPTFHFLLDHHLWIRIAQHGKILHVNQTWAAARYHAEAKNRAKAAEFGREAFRILAWAESQPKLGEAIRPVERRARASAYRVDARYRLDAGESASALKSWMRALFIHPPTALARLNILASALLNLTGLGFIRSLFLSRRSVRRNS